ncbi:MAG: sugar transferase [Chitinophagaceae bacterium]|nr:sugar transferase [Chitinophagaceae bacterium]
MKITDRPVHFTAFQATFYSLPAILEHHLIMHSSTIQQRNSKPANQWSLRDQNGIVRSFVASRKEYLAIKRVGDIIFSIVVILLLLSWMAPLLAIIIRAGTKGPAFFRQKRIGQNGRPFTCYKFRTMVMNPEADDQPAEAEDARITRIGRFLRDTNIDELPQFLNVLVGQMSVVGPRPHMVADCVRFSFVVHSYQFRHLVKPGITGLAQVNGCHGLIADYDSIVMRYYWDAQYVRKAGYRLDLQIIFATMRQLLAKIFRKFSGSGKKR